MDKNKALNREFNEVYDVISDAYDKLNEFYMEHCALGNNDVDRYTLNNISNILSNLGVCKENAHEVAEHFTWDN